MNSKWIIIGTVFMATLTAVASLGFYNSENNSETNEERSEETVLAGLNVITVETSTERGRIDFNGRVRAQHRIELFSEVPGKLVRPDHPFE